MLGDPLGTVDGLPALESTQISNDRPPIRHDDSWPICHHGVFAVGDRVKNFAVRHFTDSVILKRNDGRKTVLFGDPVARSRSAVAHHASDIETLLAAFH